MAINYKDIDPSIRQGIKTIIDYCDAINNEEYDEDEDGINTGILQLLENTSYGDHDFFISKVEDLNNSIFERFGYDFTRANILREKLEWLNNEDSLNYSYVVKILNEFDKVSCCIANLSFYPACLIKSLYSIAKLSNHDDITEELLKDTWYIMSFYSGFVNSYVYKEILKEYKYNYKSNNFLSSEEHEVAAMQDFDLFDEDLDPEIYGCSVKVKFPNGRVYKYNCKFVEINEGDIVTVSGKMKDFNGEVIERIEAWDDNEYMEEVLSIEE